MNLHEAYAALEIQPSSSKEEAKKAFKKLAAKYHPDKADGDAEKFKKINEAYQLIETGKDAGPTQPNSNPYGPWGGVGGINIEDIFGGGFDFNGGRQQQKRHFAEDKIINETISFKDSVLGCHKDISYKRKEACEQCNGNGSFLISNGCSECNGRGFVTQQKGNTFFQMSCKSCRNIKKSQPCNACNQNGTIEKDISITVNIPGGIKEGRNILRLQQMGDFAGSMFGQETYASVLLNLKVEEEKILKIEENDVTMPLTISLLEAIQGCTKSVPTVLGDKEIIIPPMSKNKNEVILKNLGVSKVGNQRVILDVEYPSNIDQLVQALKD